MIASLLIRIKHRCPWIWRAVERLNGWLFALRYPRFGRTVSEVLEGVSVGEFDFSAVTADDIQSLSSFLTGDEAAGFDHFDPHAFDCATLTRLLGNRSFAMMKVVRRSDGAIAGYFFLRCFFIGRAFHGLAVGRSMRGCGIGTAMWALSMRICSSAGVRMFATVSKHNAASLASLHRAVEATVVEELADDYLLVECKAEKL